MSARHLALDDRLYDYLLHHGVRETAVMARLRQETRGMRWGGMQISPEQGQLMAVLARAVGARRALEIGSFTGYSALWVAAALPPDGRLVACDVSEEWTAIARRAWQEAGLAERIELNLAPAAETLARLRREGQDGGFDFAFIDADKTSYDSYYEQCLHLVRPGGLILIDNVLWGGAVVEPDNDEPDTLAIRALNAKLRDDQRIDLSMVPIGDGLAICRRR